MLRLNESIYPVSCNQSLIFTLSSFSKSFILFLVYTKHQLLVSLNKTQNLSNKHFSHNQFVQRRKTPIFIKLILLKLKVMNKNRFNLKIFTPFTRTIPREKKRKLCIRKNSRGKGSGSTKEDEKKKENVITFILNKLSFIWLCFVI